MHLFVNRLVIGTACLLVAQTAASQPLGCLIEPSKLAEIGTPVTGVVAMMHVDRGDFVQAGQVIATLRADVERAAVGVAQRRALADADQQAAAANMEFARNRLVRSEDLLSKNFISTQAVEQTRTEANVAEQKLAQVIEQRRIWEEEVSLARAQLAQRTIVSPIDGVIADRYASAGERVEDKPLVRVAAINPLRVEVIVPASQFGKVAPGMVAKVTPELPNAPARSARVVRVDKVVDAASNTFRVRLELPNPNNGLPAGLRCNADLGLSITELKSQTSNNARPTAWRTSSPSTVSVAPLPTRERVARTSTATLR